MEIKARISVSQTAPVGSGPDLSSIPDVSMADVQACLKRSGVARGVHEDILKHSGDGSRISKRDLESMLARAGVETTDVKTVLAYHAKNTRRAFSDDAITFLAKMDWSDVAANHVDELKKQNKQQVESHRSFIQEDRREFELERKDDTQKLKKTNDEKKTLQQKSALEMEADFADEVTKSGLKPSSKEAFLLLVHRKRFATND